MARVNQERHIHARYAQVILNYWEIQTPEFKALMGEIGREQGYTAMNVFLQFLYQHTTEYYSGQPYIPYQKKED